MASTEEVISNIHYVYTVVLKNALEKSNWTAEELNKAIIWTKYCSKVYYETKDKAYAAQLARKLKELSVMIQDSNVPPVRFENLADVPRVFLVRLLSNWRINQDMMDMILKSEFQSSDVQMGLMFMLSITSDVQKLTTVESMPPLNKEDVHAQVHVFTLKNLLMKGNSYVIEYLEQLLSAGEADMLLQVCMLEDLLPEIKSAIHNWWLCKLDDTSNQFDAMFENLFWSKDSKLLADVCKENHRFLPLYLEYLKSYGEHMEPVFEKDITWVSRDDRKHIPNDRELACRFRDLLNTKEAILMSAVHELFAERSKKSGCAFWDHLKSIL